MGFSSGKRTVGTILLIVLLLGAQGCVVANEEKGVPNTWRKPGVGFSDGKTTQKDVLDALGPPSQVIALKDTTVFYYLREKNAERSLYLILYNTIDTKQLFDRAIFFFDMKGVLVTHSFSQRKL